MRNYPSLLRQAQDKFLSLPQGARGKKGIATLTSLARNDTLFILILQGSSHGHSFSFFMGAFFPETTESSFSFGLRQPRHEGRLLEMTIGFSFSFDSFF
ncbi:MAG: hypothetical protein C4542_09090 [Dehalococcoidia bacterium]|nr:MAG: hypothetical protein C4542_09090 [Dehalococcoidia bacterium]